MTPGRISGETMGKGYVYPSVHHSAIYNNGGNQYATDRGMNKAEVHVYSGMYHPAIKKKPSAATWIGQEIIILSEDRERQRSDIAYIVHQKNDTNQVCICLQNRNRITDLEYKFLVTREER